MSWDPVNVSVQSILELENPDLWDDYFRNARGYLRAHDAPRERFGIQTHDDGEFLAELRVLDPSGDSMGEIRRYRDKLARAEQKLMSALDALHEDWESVSILNGLICLFEEDRGPVADSVTRALKKMKVTDESLSDLIALAKCDAGFEPAVDAIVRIASPAALAGLAKIGKRCGEGSPRLPKLDEAALQISIQLHDVRVIPLLVHRLVDAYGQAFQDEDEASQADSAMRPSEIIQSILLVMQASNNQLPQPLLEQLSHLGLPHDQDNLEDSNPHLGISQAIVAKDLQPIRVAALAELDRRKMVS